MFQIGDVVWFKGCSHIIYPKQRVLRLNDEVVFKESFCKPLLTYIYAINNQAMLSYIIAHTDGYDLKNFIEYKGVNINMLPPDNLYLMVNPDTISHR